MAIAGISPIPNNKTIKGVQAVGEMGRKSCNDGFIYLNKFIYLPKKSPRITAIKQALIYPAKKRYKLTPMLTNSDPSLLISINAFRACNGEGKSIGL